MEIPNKMISPPIQILLASIPCAFLKKYTFTNVYNINKDIKRLRVQFKH